MADLGENDMRRTEALRRFNAKGEEVVTFEFNREECATMMASLSIAGAVMRNQGNLVKDMTFKDLFRIFADELKDLWT
jgi:hypothetical protein